MSEGDEFDKFKERLDRQDRKYREQLDAKDKEIALLEGRVKEQAAKVAEFGTMGEELSSLRARVQRSDRIEVMRKHGIPSDALDDIAAIYQSRMTSVPEEDRQDWDTFLGEEGLARGIVLLSHYFNGASVSSEASGAAPASPSVSRSVVAPGLPNGNAGVAPLAPKSERMKPAELQRFTRSAEFRRMSKEQRSALLSQYGSKWATPSDG